jgi:hypothetical protein
MLENVRLTVSGWLKRSIGKKGTKRIWLLGSISLTLWCMNLESSILHLTFLICGKTLDLGSRRMMKKRRRLRRW